jgi:sarcosine oxidase
LSAHDVIVVGLGGMGSAAVRHLAARGRRVLGLERFTPAHDRGSSHGASRIIRQSYFEDPAYVPLLLRAYELWEEAEKESGADLLTLCGGLYLGPEDSTTFAGSLASAREWDLPHEVLDAAAVRARFPTFTPAPDEVAVFEDRAGFVRPEASVATHLDLAARDGADLRFGQQVRAWKADGAGVRVRTDDGEHTAGHLVIAPGAWAPRLLADLGVPLRVERQVQHWFAPAGGAGPFVDNPVYIAEQAAGNQIYGFPAIDGPDGGAKVAFFRRGRDTDPDRLDRDVTATEIEEMQTRLRDTLPALGNGTPVRQVACMYTTTPDEHFVIARHPAHERVTVACGDSGHGFKFVPVVGEILADLAVDGTTRHPIALFDPRRFA